MQKPSKPKSVSLPVQTEQSPGGNRKKQLRTVSIIRRVCVLILLLGIGVLWSGCVTAIVPPRSPTNPTTVCIVDYGRHASLVLPENGTSVEFEYGEWKWFALGRTGSPRLAPVLLWPTQGTLGRREIEYAPDPARLKADRLAEHVLSFQVSSNDVERLRETLIARYRAQLDTEVLNREYGMRFVKYPVDYTAWHNCNHELAVWLEQLNCTIRGTAMFARFRVVSE